MKIGFDVAQTCVPRAGCGWYADSLIRGMVEVAPENDYFLYHHFGDWVNKDTSRGTFLPDPSVHMPCLGVDQNEARNLVGIMDGKTLPGDPAIVQSNSFQVVPTGPAKLVFVVYDVSFWVYPEFTTEANRLKCQRGVLEALQRADGLLFISQSGREEFELLLPGCLERLKKPAAAIPLASRFDGDVKTQRKEDFWLAVGSLEPRKNYENLFAGYELYSGRRNRPLPLYVAASAGWKNDEIRRRARDLQQQGKIKLLGFVEDAELQSLYQDAMALIFPSWYEGFGLPVLEAIQNGCPVICSDRTSLPEIGGTVPIYIDPARPESIAQAMTSLEDDAESRRERSEAGLMRAQQFSWRRTAQATLDFYARVLGR